MKRLRLWWLGRRFDKANQAVEVISRNHPLYWYRVQRRADISYRIKTVIAK